jgi:hypothetical protein
MKIRAALVVASLLFLAGCSVTQVSVHVPPEVDLNAAGVKSVAIAVTDLPNDPAPVGVMLKSETTSEIQKLLPSLTFAETPQAADAILKMDVVNHGVGPAYFQTRAGDQAGHDACDAWQEAFLLVNASVLTKGNPSPRWQGQLEKRNRINLSCTPLVGPVGTVASPAVSDPELVSSIVKELGKRLAGYTRDELRLGH